MGFCRTPIRDALNKLETDGLIVSKNRRKRVSTITIGDVNEIFELKKAIESHLIRLAVRRAADSQMDKLRKTVDRMRHFAEAIPKSVDDLDDLIQNWALLDDDFHRHIFLAAGSPRGERIVRNLNSAWQRMHVGLLAMEGRLEAEVERHIALGEALLARDEENAGQLMFDHLEKLRKTLTNIMEVFHIPF